MSLGSHAAGTAVLSTSQGLAQPRASSFNVTLGTFSFPCSEVSPGQGKSLCGVSPHSVLFAAVSPRVFLGSCRMLSTCVCPGLALGAEPSAVGEPHCDGVPLSRTHQSALTPRDAQCLHPGLGKGCEAAPWQPLSPAQNVPPVASPFSAQGDSFSPSHAGHPGSLMGAEPSLPMAMRHHSPVPGAP